MSDEKIIQLDEHRPHLAGKARCMQCEHEWAAVAPVGEYALDCPSCGLCQGVWCGAMLPPEGTPLWECHCGNNFMVITETKIMCAHCGQRQQGMWDEPMGAA